MTILFLSSGKRGSQCFVLLIKKRRLTQMLFGFDLNVEPGQKIALVGSTGSGRTAGGNLLMRFYPVDGVHIRRDFLRDNIATEKKYAFGKWLERADRMER